MLRHFLKIAGLLSLIGLVWGFLGRLHPSADSIALLRPVFAVGCLCGLAAKPRAAVALSLSAAASIGIVTTLMPFVTASSPGSVRVYSKNLWVGNTAMPAIADDIAQTAPDVVFLQELSPKNAQLLDLLEPEYPHQHLCDWGQWFNVAILSRQPLIGERHCSDLRALAAAQTIIEDETVWLVSAHIHWPWPATGAAMNDMVHEFLAQLDGPVILAGDLNILPWSGRVTRIANITGTRLAGPSVTSHHVGLLPLAIDHVLAPGGGTLTARPAFNSDHLGLLADVHIRPTD